MVLMDLLALANTFGEQWGLPKGLVPAVCHQESGWNPWAIRAERLYRYNWDVQQGKPFRKLTPAELHAELPPPDFFSPPGCSRTTEWWQQDMSFGLMQVMGAVARELGCQEPFLSCLCQPEVGMGYGCKLLRQHYDTYQGSIPHVLAAYNGGPWSASKTPFPNAQYVNEVIQKMQQYATGG